MDDMSKTTARARNGSGKTILALIILAFLVIGLPFFIVISIILLVYTFYYYILFFKSPSIDNVGIIIILSALTVISFYLLRMLIRWLRK